MRRLRLRHRQRLVEQRAVGSGRTRQRPDEQRSRPLVDLRQPPATRSGCRRRKHIRVHMQDEDRCSRRAAVEVRVEGSAAAVFERNAVAREEAAADVSHRLVRRIDDAHPGAGIERRVLHQQLHHRGVVLVPLGSEPSTSRAHRVERERDLRHLSSPYPELMGGSRRRAARRRREVDLERGSHASSDLATAMDDEALTIGGC